jgi:HD superfamily phosphodiesterase
VVLAGIEVTDTALVRDAVELARTSLEPYLFNHSMRSWLFGILLSEHAERPPDPELLAVSAVLHDLGLADRYTAEERFEVDGANAARAFLKDRGSRCSRRKLCGMPSHFTPHVPSLSKKSLR